MPSEKAMAYGADISAKRPQIEEICRRYRVRELSLCTTALFFADEIVSGRALNHTLVGHQPHDHRDAIVESVVRTTASPVSFSGAQFQYAVITVKGWNPDAFFIVTRSSAFQNGKFWEMTDELTEGGARAELARRGYAEPEITFLILKVRMNLL